MRNLIILVVLGLLAFAGYRAYLAKQREDAEARTLNSLPSTVRHVVAQMDASTMASFFNEYEAKKRKLSIAYVFWFFCGLHYLYFRNTITQLIFTFTVGGVWIWWMIDLFRMPSLVRSANEQVAREALQTLHIGATFAGLSGQTVTQMMTQPPSAVSAPPPPPRALEANYPAPDGGAPQWAPDPTGRHDLRYWDGSVWSDHVSDDGASSNDPIRGAR